MTNLTGGESQITFEKQVCVSSLDEEHAMGIVVALNILLSITASLGNYLILVALNKESSLHPPSKLLYICLVSTDFCVGLVLQPLNVIHLISAMQREQDLCNHILNSNYIIGVILFGVSLTTITAISVDRLFALLLRLRYRQVVTLKRIRVAVTFIWFLNGFVATMYFWIHFIFLWYGYILIAVCFVVSTSSYTKIYLTLRHHQTLQTHVRQGQPNGGGVPLNIARYRKTVSTSLWVQLVLVVCYLPYGVVTALMTSNGLSPSIVLAGRFASTLVYLNSTLNPFVYCWKIREVRQGVKEIIKNIMCCAQSRVHAFSSNASTIESTS